MKSKELLDAIIDQAEPFIKLSYVVDEGGCMILVFEYHPQDLDEMRVSISDSTNGDTSLNVEDIRSLARKLLEFSEIAESSVELYWKNNKQKDESKLGQGPKDQKQPVVEA